MQIYEEKSAEFLNFVSEMRGFESKERMDWEILREFYCGDIAKDKISIRGLLSN